MAKFKTEEEAVEAVATFKEEVKSAKAALTDYYKANKLKRNEEHDADSKHGKKIAKLEKSVERNTDKLAKAKEAAKSLKPKKERAVKYDYPADMTPEEKKKYRAKMRSQAKKSDNPKKAKKAKSEATPEKKKKKSKKSKNEDED
jgi:hypothetical protein